MITRIGAFGKASKSSQRRPLLKIPFHWIPFLLATFCIFVILSFTDFVPELNKGAGLRYWDAVVDVFYSVPLTWDAVLPLLLFTFVLLGAAMVLALPGQVLLSLAWRAIDIYRAKKAVRCTKE
jgi:hypothetical protein